MQYACCHHMTLSVSVCLLQTSLCAAVVESHRLSPGGDGHLVDNTSGRVPLSDDLLRYVNLLGQQCYSSYRLRLLFVRVTTARAASTVVCRYSWHSAGSWDGHFHC